MTNVLLVVTGANVWTLKDGTKHPTGFWAEEFVVPYTLLNEAGFEVTLVEDGTRGRLCPSS